MGWSRFDDGFNDQLELDHLSDSAALLYMLATIWSNKAQTDGFIPSERVRKLKGGSDETAAELCQGYCGQEPWWIKVDGGYQIRTFGKWNLDKAERESRREATAKRVQKWREEQRCNSVTDGVTEDVTNSVPLKPKTQDPKPKTQSKEEKKNGEGVTPGVTQGVTVLQTDDWERFLAAYPKRAGATNKAEAFNRFKALVKSGEDPERIIAGAERYARLQRHLGKVGTEYVQQMTTFLGKARGWEEDFELPDVPSKPGRPVQSPIDAAEAAILIAQEAADVA